MKNNASATHSKRRLWKIPVIIITAAAAVVIAYVLYVFLSYNRIADNDPLKPIGIAESDTAKLGEEYTALTYNLGFGAYTPDFTFFMDGGKQSWANSKESVNDCIEGDIGVLNDNDVDIACLQEVDIDSTRSYHVNEAAMIKNAFARTHCSTFAINYHSAFLFYPFNEPHGASRSGLLTLSDATISDGIRRSLPIADGFSKIIDLDRCYAINRIEVENGKKLVVFNVHLSAYGTNGDIQSQQMSMLFDDMKKAYDEGNYVICAGDFNHDFIGNSKEVFNDEIPEEYAWAADFPDDMIPDHFAKVTDYASGVITPSCRNCDKPYGPDCFTVIVDGFIVSDNIEPTYTDIIDTAFAYTDHNPVIMKFKLK